MRLTRRGWSALAVIGLAYAAAAGSGARALNAVVAPLLVALAAGAIVVWRAEVPTVSYGSLRSGPPGQTRTVRADLTGGGVVTLTQPLPAGVEATEFEATVTPPHTIERTVTFTERGVYRPAAPAVRQQDPLGLVSRHVPTDTEVEFVVYPTVYDIDGMGRSGLFANELTAKRNEFDHLREYVPGDPLRNIHWKSSVKRDGFLVMEFAPTQEAETVHIVADAAAGAADAMASSAATLALEALDAGLSVSLTVPGTSIPGGQGTAHRETILRVLAGTGPGTVPSATHESADVSVHADDGGTRVRFEGRTERFDELFDGQGSKERRVST